MITVKTKIESEILGNPDYIACYTCLTPLVKGKECWYINIGPNAVPKKEGTFKHGYGVSFAVCCSEGCAELAFIAIL
jgi:hypothetical protein